MEEEILKVADILKVVRKAGCRAVGSLNKEGACSKADFKEEECRAVDSLNKEAGTCKVEEECRAVGSLNKEAAFKEVEFRRAVDFLKEGACRKVVGSLNKEGACKADILKEVCKADFRRAVSHKVGDSIKVDSRKEIAAFPHKAVRVCSRCKEVGAFKAFLKEGCNKVEGCNKAEGCRAEGCKVDFLREGCKAEGCRADFHKGCRKVDFLREGCRKAFLLRALLRVGVCR